MGILRIELKMTNYYLDTEFIEDGKTIDLLSLALVSDDRRELYLLNADCDWSKADEWVKNNVLNSLPFITEKEAETCRKNLDVTNWTNKNFSYVPHDRFAEIIYNFCNPHQYGRPEFIAYYADYDWVVFCQLFGKMIDLPDLFPMYCKDLKQELDRLCWDISCPDFHNALDDARWVRSTWQSID